MTSLSFPMPRALFRGSHTAPVVFTAPAAPIDWSVEVEAYANALTQLEVGWDGAAGLPPSDRTVAIALDELRRFAPAGVPMPQVHPTVTGGVQFEWHSGGWSVEVDVAPDGTVAAWGEDFAGEGWDGILPAVREDLVLTLKRLV